MSIFERAAAARAAGVAQRSHRPQERRSREQAGGWAAGRAVYPSRFELRDAGESADRLHFTGYATVYEAPYEMWDFFGPYSEVVSAGAGGESLARVGLDVPLVLQHDQMRRIARTTNGSLLLSEEEYGLRVDAPDLDPADHDVAYIAPKVRSGLIDEMSFAFRIVSGVWSPDYTEYRINVYDVHRGDVAIVGYGANPATAGSGLRAQPDMVRARALLDLAIATR